MNKQRKVLITTTYNEMGIIIDTKAEEVAQPDLQPTCNNLATDTISRQAAIDDMQKFIDSMDKDSPAYKSMSIAFDRCIVELKRMPSAQPEQKNQKTALSVQVKVDFDDMKALLEDIGNLQTYKLSEGDDMVLADIEDIECILAKHVKAKEVQPERKKGNDAQTKKGAESE